jgi:hypothetical protein
VDVVGCDMLMSPKKPAIGAPAAMASTADSKSLFVFIGVSLLIVLKVAPRPLETARACFARCPRLQVD